MKTVHRAICRTILGAMIVCSAINPSFAGDLPTTILWTSTSSNASDFARELSDLYVRLYNSKRLSLALRIAKSANTTTINSWDDPNAANAPSINATSAKTRVSAFARVSSRIGCAVRLAIIASAILRARAQTAQANPHASHSALLP